MNWRKERGPLMLWREARAVISAVLALALVSQIALPAAVVRAAEGDDNAVGATPPRLSYAEGDVSYFRPGAQDWAPAQVNTALAPGDELYTGNRGNLELQVGARAFVRAWGDSQLGLVNQEQDFVQIKVTSGHVSLDLRTLDAGRAVELDTPHAAFTIDRQGYYRIDVTETSTSFVTRRSGQATMTPAGGQAVAVAASEEVVLEGAPTPTVQSYVAPELDVWDKWNYARTDDLIDAVSSRYVSAGVYGVDDLDHYGDWRVVPTYGSVWVPQSVPAGWAPYSTGRWVHDPYYGWTWVDTAPWGWAPYHYGRWVSVSGYWAWAPGPVVVRPVYAPALVAFFGGPSVKVAIGVPGISWVALSWGEPVVLHRPADVGRMGRASRRQQRRRQSHDGRERHQHQRLQEHHRRARRGGGPRGPLRSRLGAAGAHHPGRRAATRARAGAAPYQARRVELRRGQWARPAPAREDDRARRGRDARAAARRAARAG